MFPQTPWTLIAAATLNGDSAGRKALESMCNLYRPAVLDFVKHKMNGSEEAEDVTQEFFLDLMQSRLWERADQSRGKFRNFLLGAVTRTLSEVWRRRYAQKRGSGNVTESLDDHPEPAAPSETDQLAFDRAWAEQTLANALLRLEDEWTDDKELAVMLQYLPSSDDIPAYEAAAAKLGISLGAFKSRLLRFRQRYRELIEAEVARTVSSPEEVAGELDHLQQVLLS